MDRQNSLLRFNFQQGLKTIKSIPFLGLNCLPIESDPKANRVNKGKKQLRLW